MMIDTVYLQQHVKHLEATLCLGHKSFPISCRLGPGVFLGTFGRTPAGCLPTAGLFFGVGKTPD